MKKTSLSIIAALVALAVLDFSAFSAFGAEFMPLGNRALSLGGAGVTQSRGSVALYYNPALLAEHRHAVEMSAGVGAGFREDNLADNIDSLSTQNSQGNDFVGALESIASSFATDVTYGGQEGIEDSVENLINNDLTLDNFNAIFPENPTIAQDLYDLTVGGGGGGTLDLETLIDDIESGVTVDAEAVQELIVVSGNANPDDSQTVADGFETMQKMGEEGNGLQITPAAVVGIQMGSVGLGVFGQGEIAASMVIDPDRLGLIVENDVDLTEGPRTIYVKYDPATDEYSLVDEATYQAESLQYALDNGQTYLHVKGLVTVEVPVGCAHKFETVLGSMSIGFAAKYIEGLMYDEILAINTETENLGKDLENEIASSFGVDMGLLYRPKILPNLCIGVVGKNLNEPEFTSESGTQFTLNSMARAGISYDAFGDKLSISVDMDLTENTTCMGDLKSKYIGGGIEIHPASWFSIRVGAMRNMMETEEAPEEATEEETKKEGTIITAGFGFGLKWLQVDVAAAMSTEKSEFDGNEIPRYGRVQVAVISKWF